MSRLSRYSPEVRERAVRLVREHGAEHPSEWAAIESIAGKLGCTAETLRKWVRQAERDTGLRGGLTTAERQRTKELEREVRELKRINEILRKASAYFGVYPGFPTIFRGLSEFFVGDLMGKALWKLVENAQRFPRRGGRVLCVHGPVSFHRARPCATKWPPRRGLRTGPPASSDCGRPVNDKCSHQHRRSVQAERSSCPGKTVISGTYAIWETRI